jgi:hypothetical protein
LVLPPIDGPRTAAKKKQPATAKARAVKTEKPSAMTVPNSRGESHGRKLRTAAQNFAETGNKFPGMQEMYNI